MKKSVMDWPFFLLAVGLLLLMSGLIFLYPTQIHDYFAVIRQQLNEIVGIVYIWIGMCSLAFLLWVAFSKYGRIQLSRTRGILPRFSNFSWIAMIFCAGVGSGVIYWGTIEWAYYYMNPPLGLMPETTPAVEWSAAYGLFHSGPTAWAIYCLPALPIAYLYHVKGTSVLKISEACRPVLKHYADGIVGKIIDLCFVMGLLGAAGTSLGISIPMMAAGVEKVTGIEHNFMLDLALLFICTSVFAVSVYSGLDKGIKRLSDLNVYLVVLLLFIVIIFGPTIFILEVSTNSVGLIMNNFFRLNTWIDPIAKSGFPEKWTIFFWAWWIVYAPFIGLFIAKVSEGRTIKQMIFGTLIFGSLGCWIFFFVLGNYGLFLQMNQELSIPTMIQEGLAYEAIIAIIHTLPLGSVMVALFTILAIIFMATTFDTSSYMLAAVTQKRVDEDPIRWNRLFWAFALAIPPTALLFIGGLNTLQTVTVLVALPGCIIMVLLTMSFLKLVDE
ncbi:BCCT family transporter [Pontibacillus marinus]|uniref:Choline transporter BetT n=1 Tax=Pontibacillus marinus BH030004 = DSM 16465 TaxID=1385511 RepID=A0A0A5GEJ9_9BACI|nr:BCCT family transporter [Pontibacillus marinus]KGX89535.1 choline transporter BetT [Pontibacillus marinus BH030004 = DSM 16465]